MMIKIVKKIYRLVLFFITIILLVNVFLVSIIYADKKTDLSKYNFDNPFIKKYNKLTANEKIELEQKVKEIVDKKFIDVIENEIKKRLLIEKTINSKYINNKYVEDKSENKIFNYVKVSEIVFLFNEIYNAADDYMTIANYNMDLNYDDNFNYDYYDIYEALDKIDIINELNINTDYDNYFRSLIKNIDINISYNKIEHARVARVEYKYKDKIKDNFLPNESIACEIYYYLNKNKDINENELKEFVLFLYDEGIFK